jgi:hypothetical protein
MQDMFLNMDPDRKAMHKTIEFVDLNVQIGFSFEFEIF